MLCSNEWHCLREWAVSDLRGLWAVDALPVNDPETFQTCKKKDGKEAVLQMRRICQMVRSGIS